MFEEWVALGHHATCQRPDRAIEAAHGYPARRGRVQPRDNTEQAGLAAAGRTEEPHHLPLYPPRYDNVTHLRVDVSEHRTAIILKTYVVDLQQRFAEAVRSVCHYFRSSVSAAYGQNRFFAMPIP